MNRLRSFWVPLVLLLAGCSAGGPDNGNRPATQQNRLVIRDMEFELTHGEELWHGSFYSPCNEVDILLVGADGKGIEMHLPAGIDKVSPGSYDILPGAAAPLQGGCRALHSLLGGWCELVEGRVEVLVSTTDYTITLSGVDDRGNDLHVSYEGPLEYRAEGYTGVSDIRFDGRVNDLGVLRLQHYGPTAVSGLCATVARIALRPTNALHEVVEGQLTFFHTAERLAEGIYTFPAATGGTFRGTFADSSGGYRVGGGNIAVARVGEGYALHFDALALVDTLTGMSHTLTGSFTGPAILEDRSDASAKPAP